MNGSKHLQKKKIYQLRQTLNDINLKKIQKKKDLRMIETYQNCELTKNNQKGILLFGNNLKTSQRGQKYMLLFLFFYNYSFC